MGETTGMAPEQLDTLDRLRGVPGIDGFYLAGGTAVAIHLGHRRSIDLDLFSRADDSDLDRFRELLTRELRDVHVKAATDVALHLEIAGVRVDVVRYPYPLLEATTLGPGGIQVASLLDLAAMKLAAIARRGLRRDFWDLFAITQAGVQLGDSLRAYRRRYGVAQPDLYHVLRALTYFVDAERDPVFPLGMDRPLWERIKAFFEKEAPPLLGV